MDNLQTAQFALEQLEFVSSEQAGSLSRQLSALQAMIDRIHPADGNAEAARADIARARQQLRQAQETAKQLGVEAAEKYRLQLGANKERFEALDAAAQSASHPEAFALKQAYASIQSMVDQLSRVAAGLLDLEGTVEGQALAELPEQPIGDVPAYDVDPAPSSLNP